MEYRRRLIALHQDERGYALQGKRGSGLVSIDIKGDTAEITVTAKELIRPQNGVYIIILFPCHAPAVPFILGEIDYNERAMLLHKSIMLHAFPYDVGDYKAAALVFVGSHIDFVLIGQSECTMDWVKVKSNIRLKGPGCLTPQNNRIQGSSRGTMSSSISNYEKEKASVKPLDYKPAKGVDYSGFQNTSAPKKPEGKDMPLSEYGKLHFVSSQPSAQAASASIAKENTAAETMLEMEDAKGFDYSGLYDSDKEAATTSSKQGDYEKYYPVKPTVSPFITETDIEIDDAKGFDYSDMFDTSGKETYLEVEPYDGELADADLSSMQEELDSAPSVASVRYDKGLGYETSNLEVEFNDDDSLETISEIEDADFGTFELGEDPEEVFAQTEEDDEEVSLLHNNRYMASMTNEEYESALSPYGEMEMEDIDPCVYDRSEVRKKISACKKHGRRLPVRPFPAMTNSSWYKVEYPGMGSSFHYLIGSIHDEKGNVQVRCTAVPGPYGINPPAGLNGFNRYMTAQGMGNAGYWVSFVNPKTGKPVDMM